MTFGGPSDIVRQWPVRAYASWTMVPIAMRDDEAALEVFVRMRLAQLRDDAMRAGHVVLPAHVHPPTVQVQAVWIDPDPEAHGTAWNEGWARTFGHEPNALRLLTEIRVAYNPEVQERDTAQLARDLEYRTPRVLVTALMLLAVAGLVLLGVAVFAPLDPQERFPLFFTAVACAVTVAAVYVREKRRHDQ